MTVAAHYWQIGCVLLAAVLLWFRGRRHPLPPTRRRLSRGLIVVVSLLAALSYVRFGGFHNLGPVGHKTFHYADIYHYVLGAKYYEELGHENLYDATAVAFHEMAEAGTHVPSIGHVRSLRNPDESTPFDVVVRDRGAQVRSRFAPERWQAFKTDLGVWLDLGFRDQWWRTAMMDLGFNPPPSWVTVAGRLVQGPVSRRSLSLWPFLDLVLLFVVAPTLIARTYGVHAAAAFVVVLSCNPAASYLWTGGSFFRNVWMVLLVAAVCALHRERFGWAGVAFGIAAAFRVIPLFFLVGAAVPLAMRARTAEGRAALLRLLGGATLAGGLLVGASVPLYGVDAWLDWADKIVQHDRSWFVMHLGYEKLAVFGPDIGRRDFHGAEGLQRSIEWGHWLQARYDANWALHAIVRGATCAMAVGVCLRRPPAVATLVCGGLLLFCTTMPANYYYLWLALLPVVLADEGTSWREALRALVPFALVVGLLVASLNIRDQILLNGYWNRILFTGLACIAFLTAQSADAVPSRPTRAS